MGQGTSCVMCILFFSLLSSDYKHLLLTAEHNHCWLEQEDCPVLVGCIILLLVSNNEPEDLHKTKHS